MIIKPTDKISAVIQALYKSGLEIIYYSNVHDIMLEYYGQTLEVTKSEFLTAIQEWLEGKNYHLILGGRKSENPCLILYGNLYRPRTKNKWVC